MSDQAGADLAPGDQPEAGGGAGALAPLLLGYALSAVLTGCSFWAAGTGLIYGPGVPIALVALAVAQMGVHLVFFIHITTAPDNTNNVLALAFGVLIVGLLVFGSVWIMGRLNLAMPGGGCADGQKAAALVDCVSIISRTT